MCALAFYIAFSALFVLKHGKREFGFHNHRHKQRKDHKKSDHSLSNFFKNDTHEPHCFKKNSSQSYKICTNLPYTEIKCGPKYSQAKAEQTKPYLVPDVIFFIWFGDNLQFQFFNYLALRSAAAIHQPERIDFYYSISLPVGKLCQKSELQWRQ